MVQNYVHTREISIVVDDVGKCKEEVFYVNEATGDPKAEENLAPKARCGPRGFPVYTRIVFPGIPIHCILHTLVYLDVYCIAGYTRITLCGILWYSVVVWSSRFPSAPTPLIISPPPPIGIVFIRRSQHSGEKTRDYRSAALFSTSPSDPLDVIPVVAIYMQHV